jgi:hypothetical protein
MRVGGLFAAAVVASAVFVFAFVAMFNAGAMWAPAPKATLTMPLDLRAVVWSPPGTGDGDNLGLLQGSGSVVTASAATQADGGGSDGDDAVEALAEMAEDAKSTEEAAASLASDVGEAGEASPAQQEGGSPPAGAQGGEGGLGKGKDGSLGTVGGPVCVRWGQRGNCLATSPPSTLWHVDRGTRPCQRTPKRPRRRWLAKSSMRAPTFH